MSAIAEKFKSAPSWETAPKFAQYRAMSSCGWWRWYAVKPVRDRYNWEERGYPFKMAMVQAPTNERRYWKKSLQKRPQ